MAIDLKELQLKFDELFNDPQAADKFWEFVKNKKAIESPTSTDTGQQDVNEEIYEQYKEYLERYCLACASIEVRRNYEGFYLDGKLKDALYVMGGYFDSDIVASEIEQGDFPFDGIDKEGHWQVEFLLKNFRGDHEEPGYMEILVTKPCFMISFEDVEMQEMEIDNSPLSLFNEPEPPTAHTEELSTPPVREVKSAEDVLENCRLYAESKMPDDWDRKNHIDIGTFYKHFIDHLIQFTPHKEGYSVDGWVRVEDGLPRLGDCYNVVWDLEDGGQPTVTTMEWDAINKRWRDVIGEPEAEQIVTHWRPLPPPPVK